MRRRGGISRDPEDGTPVGIDDYTGFKVALPSLKKDWQGLYATSPDRRNPQDYVKGVRDNMALPFARPEAPDQFISSALIAEDGNPIYMEDGVTQIYTEGVYVDIG